MPEVWISKLFSLQDPEYKEFQSKLLPTLDPDSIIGIRNPKLRTFAREFAQTKEASLFLSTLPHSYYEENNLHMMLLAQIQDFTPCLQMTETFLPYIDNWATCDLPAPACFGSHRKELLPSITTWIHSHQTYTIRYGLGQLQRFYLEEDFSPLYLDLAATVESDEYYVNMMLAWFFATALTKQWDATLPYLREHRLSPWVHKKTIQKAIESKRISPDHKEILKNLRTLRV